LLWCSLYRHILEINRDLKRLEFKFVGSTIIYSFLQAVGVVNDHLIICSFARRPNVNRQ
jgi:3-methyladenine DNA glycosylase Tag